MLIYTNFFKVIRYHTAYRKVHKLCEIILEKTYESIILHELLIVLLNKQRTKTCWTDTEKINPPPPDTKFNKTPLSVFWRNTDKRTDGQINHKPTLYTAYK
jgi:hypothetical protein